MSGFAGLEDALKKVQKETTVEKKNEKTETDKTTKNETDIDNRIIKKNSLFTKNEKTEFKMLSIRISSKDAENIEKIAKTYNISNNLVVSTLINDALKRIAN